MLPFSILKNHAVVVDNDAEKISKLSGKELSLKCFILYRKQNTD